MSKNVNNAETNVAEQNLQVDELFSITSSDGEFIDVTDNFDNAVEISNKHIGSNVTKEGSDEILYTSGEVANMVKEPAPVMVEEEKKESIPEPKKEDKPKAHTKSCVQVVAVNDVLKTVEPEEEVKPEKIIIPGTMVKLERQKIYKSPYIPQAFKMVSGPVFIYDGILINGRYRIVSNVNKCGGDIKEILGYIPKEYIK